MDKKIAGLIGAVGAMVSLDAAQAATHIENPREVLSARSYADLLDPIPNASVALKAIDETREHATQVAQYYDHHHHHHHNSYFRRAPRVIVIPQRRSYHHHHHHHHHNVYRAYRRD